MNRLKEKYGYDQLAYSYNQTSHIPHHHVEHVQFKSLRRLIQAFLREKVFAAIHQDNKLLFLLPFTGRSLYVDNISLGSLLRFSDFGNIYIHDKNGHRRQIISPLELLDIFISELKLDDDRKNWKKLFQEVSDHLRNAALSSYKSYNLDEKIMQNAREKGYSTLLQWLENQKSISDKNLFFEQWISQGHPHHPCSKTKLGFSMEDVVKYSPEFHPEVPLQIAAIKKECIHIEAMQQTVHFTDWFSANYPASFRSFKAALQLRQLSVEEFVPLPIHPWQAKKVVWDLFREFIEAGNLYVFENVTIKASPTLSFRTLAPVEDSCAAYIKLPVAVQATSTFRTLSPGSTENAPRVSDLLNEIFVRENNFDGRLSILQEMYGLHLKNIPDEMGKNLTAIFRESPQSNLAADETCIVVAALFERSPVSNLSLFVELMYSAGIRNLEGAIGYFQKYVDLVLGSYLKLYLFYGVALEGHQQNTLAVFQNGNISRFIARDFDEIDLHEETLKKRGYSIRLYPTSTSLYHDKKHSRNSLLHTVYQMHLGELVLLLAKHFNCSEHHFWREIKKVTKKIFFDLKDKLDAETWQMEYDEIVEADWPFKALLRMRLQKKYDPEGLFLKLSNPLRLCEK